jgi:uncharacterized protein
MIGFVVLARFGLIRAIAGARFANFGSNLGSLLIYARSGQILVAAGLAMGVGASPRGSALIRRYATMRALWPLIVVVRCAMALKLMSAPGGLFASAWKLATSG